MQKKRVELLANHAQRERGPTVSQKRAHCPGGKVSLP